MKKITPFCVHTRLWEMYWCSVYLLILTRPQLYGKAWFVGVYESDLYIKLKPNSEVGWNAFVFPGDHYHFTEAPQPPWPITASLHAALTT